MHDFPNVTVVHSLKQLAHHIGCILFREVLDFGYLIEQFTSFNEFCDQIDVKIVLVKFVKTHYIRVIKLLQDFDLILQWLHKFFGNIIFPDNLHGSKLSRSLMLNFLNFSIGAFPNSLQYSIPSLDLSLLLMNKDWFINDYIIRLYLDSWLLLLLLCLNLINRKLS